MAALQASAAPTLRLPGAARSAAVRVSHTVVCVVNQRQLARLRCSARAPSCILQTTGGRSRKRSVVRRALGGVELSSAGSVSLVADVNRIADVGLGLELSVQLSYLLTLLALLAAGSYLVVRQVLVRNELETAAKDLGERVRAGTASSQDYYEMGCIMLRKKVYTQALKNLQLAEQNWDGEDGDLAGLYNALGYASQNLNKPANALDNYKKAVALQPGYTIAWKNMGDVLEADKKYSEALSAYEQAAALAPDDKVARDRISFLRTRLTRFT